MNIKRLLLCGLTATALLLQSLCVASAAESSMLYEDFSSSLGVMTAEGSWNNKAFGCRRKKGCGARLQGKHKLYAA